VADDNPRDYEAHAGDANLPIPDPTRLTTQLVDRAIAAFREVMETRLAAMDKAIILGAERVERRVAGSNISHSAPSLDCSSLDTWLSALRMDCSMFHA